MDTKLKADIAESAVITELLKRGLKVLKPIGDRLPCDLALDFNGKLIRIQAKSAWFNSRTKTYYVDVRRTRTNRRRMLRDRYDKEDFDFAILYNGPHSWQQLMDNLSNSVEPSEMIQGNTEPSPAFSYSGKV